MIIVFERRDYYTDKAARRIAEEIVPKLRQEGIRYGDLAVAIGPGGFYHLLVSPNDKAPKITVAALSAWLSDDETERREKAAQ